MLVQFFTLDVGGTATVPTGAGCCSSTSVAVDIVVVSSFLRIYLVCFTKSEQKMRTDSVIMTKFPNRATAKENEKYAG